MSDVIDLARELIQRRSITPQDAGCLDTIADRLDAAGFVIERLPFGEVDNLWARRGNSGPLVCFAGHTDVVPPGPAGAWDSDPFEPEIRNGLLFGRGAADMKGSIAAMVVAAERFTDSRPDHDCSLAFLLTSDEEGVAIDGTRRVMEVLRSRSEQIDYCVVGEPSSHDRLGDRIRVGRRGSLHGRLTIQGVQGHVAYPQLARNPIHDAAPALTRLTTETWDQGNDHFPPTSFQISNLKAGTGADNVIPGELEALFNFRFSTAVTEQQLRDRTESLLTQAGLDFTIDWRLSGVPFLTQHGKLVDSAIAVIEAHCGYAPQLSTGGGTSDGRFIAPSGAELIELGPVNASIHKVNEHVEVSELERLADLYQALLLRLDGA
ncbi:MAG: succinyl-diaminopimelate desuccinylase [Gammaproteobacteria bacterium]|nr:succinyl-diaminopimelate desuccinylase [Gammaproteobacteria bacterium]NND60670.1 succinyl-diaminopimelate desuccinylase [Gammaproteobacteria bacterium]